jgi:hypothetical protein
MNSETISIPLAQRETAERPEDVLDLAERGKDVKSPAYKIVLLSTSLLVDRVLRYTGLVDRLLQEDHDVEIWNSSIDADERPTYPTKDEITIRPFPEVKPFRELRHNFLRRLNEFVWDYRYRLPSRESMMNHVRNKNMPWQIRLLKGPARLLAFGRAERVLESVLEKWLISYPRSPEATKRFIENRPDVIVSTGPFQFEQPAVFSAAKNLNIPVIAYIPSWDNVTTKNRLVFDYDGYIVWNEKVKHELLDFYPTSRRKPIYVVGAPQFDVFYQDRFFQTREIFCRNQNLDPDLPIIVYAIGSPNFLKEHHGAIHLAKEVCAGALGNVQLLVRPHPIHDNAEMKRLFDQFRPKVRLQESINAGKALTKRTQDADQVTEWINTFRHADVVVNIVSTVAIDAAIFDTPVVNLDFDPQPGQGDQQLVKDVNHIWPHYKPIAESGGVWLVNDFDETINAIRIYLERPELHRAERKWMVEHVCGFADGNSGARMADAIRDFVENRARNAT